MNETERYLAHYGVLGMRWGIRRASGTREFRKNNRIHKRGEKLVNKANMKQEKAEHLQEKARKSRYGITDTGRTIWERRQIKAGKALRKADKATKKAEKWIEKNRDLFSDMPISELNK